MCKPIGLAVGFVAITWLTQLLFALEVRAEAETDVDVAIQRSVPFLEREGLAWIGKRQCVSCHQVPFMLWGLNAAKNAGFGVDEASLAKHADWSLTWQSWQNPKNASESDEASTAKGNVDTMYFLLLGRSDYESNETKADQKANLRRLIVANQQADGSFKPGGQLPKQRRPLEATTQVATMWALLALPPREDDADRSEARRKALEFLEKELTPASAEWVAARLLLDLQLGDAKAAERTRTLLAAQNEDGGWGWLLNEQSDAFGTGLALYALSQVDKQEHPDAIGRAQRFLTSSQAEDGSWPVPGTKQTAQGKPRETSTYWGTAWAVIGLCETR